MSNGKHAYLVMAHGNFGQLRKLILSLDNERNDIYLHVDAKSSGFDAASFENLCQHAEMHIIKPRVNVHWGGPSQIEVEMLLLQEATANPHSYYHLLSGMDLPIKSQEEIHSFFDEHSGHEFIQFWKLKKSTASRYSYYTVFPDGAGHFATNLANNIVKGIQMALKIRINRGIDFSYGPNWFSITDELARYVVSKRDWVRSTFAHTNNCDEVFLQTLVRGSEFESRVYDSVEHDSHEQCDANMRFIDWTRGPSVRHPWVFVMDDIPLLAAVPHMFARKFDERTDSAVIDEVLRTLCHI